MGNYRLTAISPWRLFSPKGGVNMYEVIEIQQEIWLIPKFDNWQELSDWERLWLNSQKDVLVKGSKIHVDPGDAYAIEDKIGEEISIEEIFKRWVNKFGVYTAPSPEHLECDTCDISMTGDNRESDLCNEHLLNL